MRIGERTDLSTFGAVGDELKADTLYRIFERSNHQEALMFGNLGGNAEFFRPLSGLEDFFYWTLFLT